MSDFTTIKNQIQKLIDTANEKTGKADADLTGAVGSLVEGYGGSVKPVPRVPACEVRVVVPSGIEYYYNHEKLPEIPADVIENYPYIIIVRHLTTTRIYASNGIFYYHVKEDGTKRIDGTAGSGGVRYTLNTDANAWVLDSVSSRYYGLDMNGDGNWSVWWSNYDIPKGSADSDEVYWYASEAQAEETETATQFYYNGVRLPRIPDDVLASYPYAWIRNNTKTGYYDLILSVVPCYKVDTAIHGGYSVNSSYDSWYRTPISSPDAWEQQTHTYGSWGLDNERTVLWSNHDIPNGSADATDIYFYGTVAVPDTV